MEEKNLRNTEAAYFKSAVKMFTGNLILTTHRILFTGEHARIQVNHGLLGNVIRDKMEKAMGYDNPEEFIINIPLTELEYEMKRFGFSKRLILRDKNAQSYNIQINKKLEREEWPKAIDAAKKAESIE